MSGRALDETPTSCVTTASGVIAGLRPRRLARIERSASSPYMKKRRSKPPSSRQSRVGTSSRQPVTTPTSRTESRCQPPSDSGSNTRVPLKATLSMVAKQARLQSEGSPSTSRGRPCRSDAACGHRRARARGACEVDEVRDGALVHDRVGVEQEQVLALRLRGPVHAGRETDVLVEREQLRLRELAPHHLGRPVARRVVEHHDLEVDAVRVLVDRGQAVARLGAALVRDDQDRDVACRYVLEFRRTA